MNRLRRIKVAISGLGIALVFGCLVPVSASSANISHSFTSVNPIQNGSLVSLDPSHTNYVQLANTTNDSQLLGVAVASTDSLLAVDSSSGNVQIATSGTASALVSTLTGNIKVGDLISVSPFNGVGSRATTGNRVIGLAQTSFNTGSAGAHQTKVTDKQGRSRSIAVGYVRLNIGIATASRVDSSVQLNALQKFARSLTGKTVSLLRVVASLIVAIVAILALITLVYATIFSGIISVGRNPLAKNAVFLTVGSVLVMALVMGALASATVYFLLS